MKKSWKTTLFGAFGVMVLSGYDLVKTGQVDTKTLLISSVFAGLSFLAKDFNVSGK